MLSAKVSQLSTAHEVVSAFDSIGLALHRTLESMLNEAPEHQTPRRGCGLTQTGRFLARIINKPRKLDVHHDLQIFSDDARRHLQTIVHTAQTFHGRVPKGISELLVLLRQQRQDPLAQQHCQLIEKLIAISTTMELEESRLVAELILSILGKNVERSAVQLPLCKTNLEIGTCPEAERYFLEFAGHYVRRQGIINIFTDDNDLPLLIEKMNIGDSHSCVTLQTLSFNGVTLPPGSLLGANYSVIDLKTPKCAEIKGVWSPIQACEGFRFLRLTTLAVSPENRKRAFKNHLAKQLEGTPFFDPTNTRLSDLQEAAERQRP